ncbi:MAG: hypothetical protein ACREE9_10725 [Stellaceae bacterium]
MTDQRADDRELPALLDGLGTDAAAYFKRAAEVIAEFVIKEEDRKNTFELMWEERQDLTYRRDKFWTRLPEDSHHEASRLDTRLLSVMKQVAVAVRGAPLASEADQRDVMLGTKAMRAALLLRQFRHQNMEVLHDEGTVLGVEPASQSDDHSSTPEMAGETFAHWKGKITAILDLVAASPELGTVEGRTAVETARYRPGTAFIMMWMDRAQPALTDVSDAVKDVFAQFDIHAVRADDIEHEGLITPRILSEIKTAEFCIADLTGGRPNVYYEVGYAHALLRRVILYRKAGTGLHFDLTGYNCPEYTNLRDLKNKLTQRLRVLTNREPKTPI